MTASGLCPFAAKENDMTGPSLRIAIGSCLALIMALGDVSKGAAPDVRPTPVNAKDCNPSSQANIASLRFAVEILTAASKGGAEGAIVGPLGVEAILAMASYGATAPLRGAVRRLFADATGTWKPECRLAAVLIAARTDDGVDLHIANGAFPSRELDVFPAFRAALEDRFGAKVVRLDFSEAQATDTINARVKKKTNGMIPRLLATLGADTVLVLVNALHFSGQWAVAFDPARTMPRPFHLGSGEVVERATMRIEHFRARYRQDEDLEAVELPYGDGGFALTVVLPRLGVAPADALDKIESDPSWFGHAGFGEAVGTLYLPRIDLAYKNNVLPLLKRLGLAEALAEPVVFSGIAAPAPRLSHVVHGARLTLDEEGTEAGAATAAVFTKSMKAFFEMQVDRPFALAVRKRDSGELLFVAWVDDPGNA